MKFKIKVPATVANIGSGFDSAGMAINLYNETIFEFKKGKEKKVKIFVEGSGKNELENKEKNLLFKVFKKFCKKNFSELKIIQKNKIPLRRGLGSSSTAIITGIAGALLFSKRKIDKDFILKESAKIEGHPDNVTPAIFGGINLVKTENYKIKNVKIVPEKELKILLLIPDFEILTEKARKILPEKIKFKDAISNLQNFGFLISSFYNFKKENLLEGVKDFLHQPYRLRLIKGAKKVINEALKRRIPAGISGSGPTIFCFIEKNEKISQILKKIWKKENRTIEINEHICKIDKNGLRWEIL